MTLTFIWKKQLVWFITLLLVIILGLTIGAMLQDVFWDESDRDVTGAAQEPPTGTAPGVKVAIPSLPFPTSPPGDAAR